ncbi:MULTISPECIES: glycosyltransferase family 2 protein [unclassified Lentimicrobium]|uniref:glycosyltransferase family 2 protein n=1 Tax=unclassified Lentimicrobium TaxID=2677434 RepID=UPI00155644E2|nr:MULTISPECIES: glycosyltransferase family 2 protein [unclassified Lentimicrobium]NPD44786.1 glycosyltransferase family 2 protein [Lentimicrobium sp. S6]NPD83197.1 glycosyltransferase family 2 protein [Lentimicrobium sp. L6]
MDISVIVPVYNEVDSLPKLAEWIEKVMDENKFSYEVLFVDDGSRDGSWKVIEELSNGNFRLKGIRFQRNYGKSAALNQGFTECQGEVVITMDADLQDSPDEIPGLYDMIMKDKFDLVSGWKKKRNDPLNKTIPSKFFNGATGMMTGIKLHDFNCGLKAYHSDVIKSIEVYGEMHRYIPVIAKWAGFNKIGEKVVTHYPRQFGITKFGIERYVNGFLDLLSISFVGRFGKRPMHFFGFMGTLVFFVGFVIAMYLAYAKFFMEGYRMTDRPLFYFGLLAMAVGVQLFLAGFLGELISRSSNDKNNYLIAKTVGLKDEK